MTEQSMFFEDGSYYNQVQYARVRTDIFGHNGVVKGVDNELSVEVNNPANMAVKVNPGRLYINGYTHEILTDPVQLTFDAADPTNPRIDRVVLRLNVNDQRCIKVAVLKGTPASSPVAPTLTQTASVWEEPLYKVTIRANTLSIIASDLADERQYMWFNRTNMPKTSKSEYGAVKVGSGIDVSNGVISLSAITNVLIQNVSSVNEGGFAIGSYSFTQNEFTNSSMTVSGWKNVGDPYNPFGSAVTASNYPPFHSADATHGIGFTATGKFNGSDSSYTRWEWGLRAVRVSDGTVLAEKKDSKGLVQSFTGTITMVVDLPANWNVSTDRIQFKAYGNQYLTLNAGTMVSAGDVSGTKYFKPTAGA